MRVFFSDDVVVSGYIENEQNDEEKQGYEH